MVKPSLAGLYLRLKLMPALQMAVMLLRLNCHDYVLLFSIQFGFFGLTLAYNNINEKVIWARDVLYFHVQVGLSIELRSGSGCPLP